jgi:hypothetical protein
LISWNYEAPILIKEGNYTSAETSASEAWYPFMPVSDRSNSIAGVGPQIESALQPHYVSKCQ